MKLLKKDFLIIIVLLATFVLIAVAYFYYSYQLDLLQDKIRKGPQ
ncbi:MAG: hypothetical protein QM737_06385 [Ferruginibacter sp.]